MVWRRRQQKGRVLLLVVSWTALLWIVPFQKGNAQFLSPQSAGEISGPKVRERTEKKKKGTNVAEWVKRLRSDRPETRLEAVKSLGDSKDPKAIDPIIGATEDADLRVKVKAIEYLGTLRATEATPILAQQLFLRDVHPAVKQKILIALGKIGDQRGAEPIMDFLRRNLDIPTKGTALFALRAVGNDHVLTFLDDYARSEPSPPLRQLAQQAAIDIRHRLSPEFSPVVPTFIKQVELRNKAERGEQEQ
jgi:hypothetical protein